ncbi:MAG: T9SS type A sorting domain-containing protein [Bacteroidota bacterium]
MKKNSIVLIISFITLVFSSTFHAQYNINAGADTTICVTPTTPGTLTLGGNPTAGGGTAPYSYSWECTYNYIVGPNTYILTASDFLSDTAISNPNLIHTLENPVTFTLKVTDNLGQIMMDTIIVSFSIFYIHMFEWTHNMLSGDSVEFVSLPNVGGGIAPLTYLWRPNNGLTDSTSYTNFWLNPVVSTSYYITLTDAVGCVVSGPPVFHIYIGFAELNELFKNKVEDIVVYPNPSDGSFLIKTDGETINQLQIFNQKGEHLITYENPNNTEINISDFEKGIYTLVISIGTESFSKTVTKM